MTLGPAVTNEGEDFQFKASLEQKVKLLNSVEGSLGEGSMD